ncbi:MAG: hypothetical protein GY913_25780 [Proteobacteria bacterium]|nr:hypothetical protein [Pseudomonadota bacterium]MCP4920326.1 hypothetical protein [Pseudomonadota bacterium]
MLRGLIVFDTLRTYGPRAFRLDEHLGRLERSAATCGIPMPSRDLLNADIAAVSGPDHWVRVTLTAGGNRIVEGRPIDQGRVGRPLRCATVPVLPSPYLPGSVKHGSRLGWVLAARQLAVGEVIFVDPNGHLLESNRSNLLAVVDGGIVVPPDDGRALSGVTRGAMLEAAGDLPLEVRDLRVDERLDELYLVSTLKELAPVSELDGRPIGGGPVGKTLHGRFRDLVRRSLG